MFEAVCELEKRKLVFLQSSISRYIIFINYINMIQEIKEKIAALKVISEKLYTYAFWVKNHASVWTFSNLAEMKTILPSPTDRSRLRQ